MSHYTHLSIEERDKFVRSRFKYTGDGSYTCLLLISLRKALWQIMTKRRANKNTDGLIRQFFSKGT